MQDGAPAHSASDVRDWFDEPPVVSGVTICRTTVKNTESMKFKILETCRLAKSMSYRLEGCPRTEK
jgi:hypothetical protein